jgi:hypothetical protein
MGYLGAIVGNLSECLLFGVTWPSLLLVLALAAFGAAVLIRRQRGYLVLAAYGLLHFAAYLYLRPFATHTWHQFPGVLVTALFVLGSLCWASFVPSSRSIRSASLALMVALLCGYAWRTVNHARTYPHSYWLGTRNLLYRDVAAHLREHARPGDTLGALEVGTVAYYSGIRVFDLGGLVTRGQDYQHGERMPSVQWLMVDPEHIRWARRLTQLAPVVFSRDGETVLLYEIPQGLELAAILH